MEYSFTTFEGAPLRQDPSEDFFQPDSASRFEVSRQTHRPSYSMHAAHTHSYFELYYLVSGECTMFLMNHLYRMPAGSLVCIPAGALHRTTYYGENAHERIYVEFTLDYASDLIALMGKDRFEARFYRNFFFIPEGIRPAINQIFQKLFHEREDMDSYSQCMLRFTFQQLLITVLRNCHNMSDYQDGQASLQVIDVPIQTAMDYISTHFRNKITLEEVARQLHMNPSYLSRKFKLVNDFGFKEYLNNLRINYAEKLLLETEKSITEISFECGYENSNYFGDAFHRINGISPTKFRQIKGNVKD